MAMQPAPMRRSSTTAVVVVLMLTTAALVSTQDPSAPQAPPQPTFRAGVNVIRVDVIVNDDKGNPVTDLAREDFEIVEDGRPQTIDLFRHVRIDGGTPSDGARTRQALSRDTEEREASRDDVRIFAILLADYHVCQGRSRLVRDALSTFVRTLGPNDLVAVMNPLTSVRDLAFSYDHDAILQTIQRFEGRRGDYTPRNPIEEEHVKQMGSPEPIRHAVVRDALTALSVRLGSMREGRKSVIFVSEGFPPGWFSDPRQLGEITKEANRHNTSIYPIDPRGLMNGDSDVAPTIRPGCGRMPSGMRLRLSQDTLRELANDTDGRAIVDRNSLTEGLAQILRDSSLYYLLGYSSTVLAGGRQVSSDSCPRETAEGRRPCPQGVLGVNGRGHQPRRQSGASHSAADPRRPCRDRRVQPGGTAGSHVGGNRPRRRRKEPRDRGMGTGGRRRALVRGDAAARITITANRPKGETVFETAPADLGAAGVSQNVAFDVPAGSLELKIIVVRSRGSDARSRNATDRGSRLCGRSGRPRDAAVLSRPHGTRVPGACRGRGGEPGGDARVSAHRAFADPLRCVCSGRRDAVAERRDSQSCRTQDVRRPGDPRASGRLSHQIDLTLSPLPAGEYLLEVVAAPSGITAAGGVSNPLATGPIDSAPAPGVLTSPRFGGRPVILVGVRHSSTLHGPRRELLMTRQSGALSLAGCALLATVFVSACGGRRCRIPTRRSASRSSRRISRSQTDRGRRSPTDRSSSSRPVCSRHTGCRCRASSRARTVTCSSISSPASAGRASAAVSRASSW